MTTDEFLHLTTEGLPQRKAKEYWADHVGDACHNLQMDFNKEEHFQGNFEYKDLNFGKLTNFHLVGQHKAHRTPYYIAKEKTESFCVALAKEGNAEVSSRGKEVIWKDSRIYCGGSADSYLFSVDKSVRFSVIYFDMSYARTFIPYPEDLFLKEVPYSTGWGKALESVMQEITPRTISHLALPPGTVADHVLGLLALSVGPEPDHLSSSQRSQLERLRQGLRDRLFDPHLNPTCFAAEHGISVRTLHALFTASGNTFMRELLGMRLARARSFLEDRRYDTKTIAEIALLVGFVNADHFTARFRKAFGAPPTEWRKRSGGT